MVLFTEIVMTSLNTLLLSPHVYLIRPFCIWFYKRRNMGFVFSLSYYIFVLESHREMNMNLDIEYSYLRIWCIIQLVQYFIPTIIIIYIIVAILRIITPYWKFSWRPFPSLADLYYVIFSMLTKVCEWVCFCCLLVVVHHYLFSSQ